MRKPVCLVILAAFLYFSASVYAQSELWLQVTDARKNNVRDVRLRERESTQWSAPTSDSGLTKLDLPATVTPGAIIYLELLQPPDLRIVVPLNARVVVPASQGPELVRVLRKREIEALQYPELVTGIASLVIQKSLPDSVEISIAGVNLTPILRRAALRAVAGELELPPDELDKAIRDLGDSVDDPFIKAMGKLYSEDYAAADTNFKLFLQTTDAPQKAWIKSDAEFFRGAAYLQSEQFNDAVGSFKQATVLEPKNPRIFAAYGISLYRANRFEESLETWDKLLELQPTNKSLYLNQGFTLDKLGRSNESIGPFERYLKLEGDGPLAGKVYNHLGDSYLKAGKPEKALVSYRASLKSARITNDTVLQQATFTDLRNLYLAKPDLKVAAAYNEELLITARDSKDKRLEVLLLSSLGSTYAQQGETDKALDTYAAAVKSATESNALSEVELVPLFKAYATLLHKNHRELEAQRLESRVQLMLGDATSNSAAAKH